MGFGRRPTAWVNQGRHTPIPSPRRWPVFFLTQLLLFLLLPLPPVPPLLPMSLQYAAFVSHSAPAAAPSAAVPGQAPASAAPLIPPSPPPPPKPPPNPPFQRRTPLSLAVSDAAVVLLTYRPSCLVLAAALALPQVPAPPKASAASSVSASVAVFIWNNSVVLPYGFTSLLLGFIGTRQ